MPETIKRQYKGHQGQVGQSQIGITDHAALFRHGECLADVSNQDRNMGAEAG